jgi:UDP-N-acetyl-2-amino-2-deoxyglucuronate dehydrogenase
MRQHGFGVVGTGVIAATHAKSIAALPNAHLVAVTDVRPDSAEAFAAAHGCAVEPDLAALLARADVDVVSVCVPSGLHADVGIQAAAAGKHLVVEKPIEVTLAAADKLIGAVQTAGVSLTVISQHRFDAGLIELHRLLDGGALGELVLGESSTKWYRTQAYYDSAAWRGTRAFDGGALLNQGVHYVDLLRWCMGPVAEVTALCATRAHQMEAEDVAVAMLRFTSGAVGMIVASTAVFPGFAQRLEITGTNGTVIVEDGEIVRTGLLNGGERDSGSAADPAAAADPADPAPGDPAPPDPAGDPAAAADPAALGLASHAAQIADLLAAIEEGRQPLVTAQDGRDALEIVCAVYESASEGRTVVLPQPDPVAAR